MNHRPPITRLPKYVRAVTTPLGSLSAHQYAAVAVDDRHVTHPRVRHAVELNAVEPLLQVVALHRHSGTHRYKNVRIRQVQHHQQQQNHAHQQHRRARVRHISCSSNGGGGSRPPAHHVGRPGELHCEALKPHISHGWHPRDERCKAGSAAVWRMTVVPQARGQGCAARSGHRWRHAAAAPWQDHSKQQRQRQQQPQRGGSGSAGNVRRSPTWLVLLANVPGYRPLQRNFLAGECMQGVTGSGQGGVG